MDKRQRNHSAIVALLAVCICVQLACTSRAPEGGGAAKPAAAADQDAKATPPPAACALPTTMASTNEQTAWQLFVAANCPVNNQLKWETWTEQSCFENPATPGCPSTAEVAAAAA